mmetsp:Transcript_3094/g.11679  ORF Transcript_3094/g.11679 Transcript_3094/m.11679 type:complete len:200 (+) Transcript_3094:493-1092(+)
MAYPSPFMARITPIACKLNPIPCSRMYRACNEYVNGTQTRSPNTNMNPNPSVVTSIVVKIAGSNHSASATYRAWKRHTRAMGCETWPVFRNCACANPKSSNSHPINPGVNSQNTFRSNKPPTRGLSSRPMKKSYTWFPVLPPLARSFWPPPPPRFGAFVVCAQKESKYSAKDAAKAKRTPAVKRARKFLCTQLKSRVSV